MAGLEQKSWTVFFHRSPKLGADDLLNLSETEGLGTGLELINAEGVSEISRWCSEAKPPE